MMDAARVIAAQLATIPSVRSETAVFLGMSGAHARVKVGPNEVVLPCVGFYPPVVGMTVQVEWRDGKAAVIGPATPLNTIGTIISVAAPLATVNVDGKQYTLPYRRGYSPLAGDIVEIRWEGDGVIQGALSITPEPPPPPVVPPPAPTPFDVTVRATDSGRYQTSWWGNDPWASSNNRGIWVYGGGIRDALAGSKTLTSLEILLPLISEVGSCQIGIAHHDGIPAGAPTITDLTDLPLGRRSGWQPLPTGWLGTLAAGGRGIGVVAPGGAGYTRWRGTALDGASGMLRIRGTR